MLQTLREYHENKSCSYSVLAALDVNQQSLLVNQQKEKESFTFGSLVDCMAYTPDILDYRFFISTVPKPAEKAGDWIDAFLELEIPPDFRLRNIDHLILQARKNVGYQMNWKDDTILNKFEEICFPYLDVIAKAGDRNIITQDDYNKAESYIIRLTSNEFVGKYFRKIEKGIELQFQVPCYYTIENVPFKSLIDCLYIDHNNKTVTVVDLKTTSKPLNQFEHSFIDYRYYIQAALYQEAVRLSHAEVLVKGYKVHFSTLFIVINENEAPMIWECPQVMISTAWVGGITRYGRKIKGIHQLIEQYKWHMENQIFDYPMSTYLNNGKKVIDVL